MNSAKRLMVLAAVLFVGQAILCDVALRDQWNKEFGPGAGKGLVHKNSSPEQVLLQLFGLREFAAGILWVKADSFFDTGNYDAILPIIRLVTWLDPKQIDVYATGMWHMGYNFTDEEQRSDRRYIPSALALGKEGSERNPQTYELFFETGWMWYHKIDDDYGQAVKYLLEAQKRPDMLTARKNLLSNAFQRNGQVNEALATYLKFLDDANVRLKKDPAYGNMQNRDTIESNVDTLLVRMSQRGYFAMQRNDGSYQKGPYDTKPPFDVGFGVKMTVEDPRIIRFEGMWNVLPVGTRIRVTLRDENYPGAKPAELEWDSQSDVDLDPPRNLTYMQDSMFVKNRRFNRKVDMSKDPTMYPFTTPKYIIEFYYNPRSGALHLQDKFGWNGEGMTDANFLNTEVRPGQRVVYTKLELTRDQILRRGEWQDRVPVVKTANYIEPKGVGIDDEMFAVPGIMAQPKTGGG